MHKPLAALLLALFTTIQSPSPTDYPNFNHNAADLTKDLTDKSIEWTPAIAVTSPAYGATIHGPTQISFRAPGMTHIEIACWQQPTPTNPNPLGHDAQLAPNLTLDANGNASFTFPADDFPNGPLTLRIYARDDNKKRDICELQLFNTSGHPWNQGLPKSPPPAAANMTLLFADDFTSLPTISPSGKGVTYQSHKTGGGDFSGWPFVDNTDVPPTAPPGSAPFSQVGGTYLKIHASKPPGTQGFTGILSSAHDGFTTGTYATAPCYFECRFIAHSAPGTWPAFWLLTKPPVQPTPQDDPTDELDIIEAYGGQGPGNPNFPNYAATSHFWNQKSPDGKPQDAPHADIPMLSLSSKSSWSTTFHTYGCLITPTDTIYYLDDIEVLRHPTNSISQSRPFFFLINYAIGGISGWKIDLARYNNSSDMYVDYVRVYQGKK